MIGVPIAHILAKIGLQTISRGKPQKWLLLFKVIKEDVLERPEKNDFQNI